jgi:hypothetical protein
MPACTRQGVEMVTRKIREDGIERGILIYAYKLGRCSSEIED